MPALFFLKVSMILDFLLVFCDYFLQNSLFYITAMLTEVEKQPTTPQGHAKCMPKCAGVCSEVSAC